MVVLEDLELTIAPQRQYAGELLAVCVEALHESPAATIARSKEQGGIMAQLVQLPSKARDLGDHKAHESLSDFMPFRDLRDIAASIHSIIWESTVPCADETISDQSSYWMTEVVAITPAGDFLALNTFARPDGFLWSSHLRAWVLQDLFIEGMFTVIESEDDLLCSMTSNELVPDHLRSLVAFSC